MAYKKYFAAANTANGFVSYFSDIFAPEKLSRLYIIKGGPGTGKSTMMKLIADTAAEKGYEPELYYCSSDPASLDGVLIPELSAAVIDGTPPHSTDPKYPGAVETLLDFGAYFDRGKLREQREEIIRLCKKHSELYERASAYYSHAGAAAKEALAVYSSCVCEEKLSKLAKRTAEKLTSDKGEAKRGQVTAFSTAGFVRLDTFGPASVKRVAVCGSCGEGALFIERICSELSEKGIGYEYNVMNIMPDKRDIVYVPGSGLTLEAAGKPDKKAKQEFDKTISSDRFTDKKRLSESKAKLRMLKKIETSFYTEAVSYMRSAGEAHAGLERIYKNAVDFDGVRELMRKVSEEIFGN